MYDKQKVIGESPGNGDQMKGYCTTCGQPINNYKPGVRKCGGDTCLDDT